MDQPEMYQWCKIHQTWIILFLLKMTLQIVWYLFCISSFSLKLQITHYYLYMQFIPLICIFNFLSLKAAFKMKTWKTCHYKIPLEISTMHPLAILQLTPATVFIGRLTKHTRKWLAKSNKKSLDQSSIIFPKM